MKSKRTMIDFTCKITVQKISKELKCSEQVLRYCGTLVGPSKTAIECYLSMNREWLMKFKKQENAV